MYNLKISKKQAETIVKALDIYSRLLCGQVGELGHLFREKVYKGEIDGSQVRETAYLMKKVLFPELHPEVSYGICSPDAPEDAKIGYDILQVVRNRVAWDGHQPGSFVGVNHSEPLKTSEEGLPMMDKGEEVEGDGN